MMAIVVVVPFGLLIPFVTANSASNSPISVDKFSSVQLSAARSPGLPHASVTVTGLDNVVLLAPSINSCYISR